MCKEQEKKKVSVSSQSRDQAVVSVRFRWMNPAGAWLLRPPAAEGPAVTMEVQEEAGWPADSSAGPRSR